jgi:hypothetical protein
MFKLYNKMNWEIYELIKKKKVIDAELTITKIN